MKKNDSKFKSIKTKIKYSIMLTVGVSLCILGIVTAYLNYTSTVDTVEQTMLQLAEVGAERVSQEIRGYMNIVEEAGTAVRFTSSAYTIEDKEELLHQKIEAHGFVSGDLLDKTGRSIFENIDYSDREFYTQAMKGNTYVSEPLVSKLTGKLSIIISAPLWKDGTVNTSVEGVIYFIPDEEFLNNIVRSINVSENGKAYIIGATGNTVAHENIELVKNMDNTINEAKSDSSLKDLAQMEEKMLAQEQGFGRYEYEGVEKFLSYAPISSTDGWSIGINAPTADFMDQTVLGIVITCILLIVSMIISGVIAVCIANKIANPIKMCADRLRLISKGDLKSSVPQVNTNDETKILLDSSKEIIYVLNKVIGDVDYLLGAMADGNFNVRTTAEEYYVGDLNGMLMSIRKINRKLSNALKSINVAAEQVSSGSEQVSSGAQSLSQGTTEQAASIQELAANINEVFERVQQNVSTADEARNKTIEAKGELDQSNNRMQDMLIAMSDISEKSKEIKNIIKVIEDIAFQTNILALNAAVEAARAGDEGKGFSVVAGEVRELASKSAQASKNSAELIENSLKSVEKGAKIANDTANSLAVAVENINNVANLVDDISKVSEGQYEQVKQVNEGADQISSVVQTNSATSEESAAISHQLSDQAEMLKKTVSIFQLRED